ncbi:MAG: P-loop NTPase fold protein, partial [Planctomycetota bacterium]
MPDQPTDTDNPNIDIPEIGPYAWTVNALVKEISNRSETHDFKISGFFGPWGSGKTTLLREVVDKVNGDERRNAHVEIFDAWEARDDDNLPLSIIAHLIEPDHKKIWTNNIPKKALDYVTTALSTMSRLIGGPGIADVAKDKKVAKEITFSAKDNLLIQHAETRKNRALLEEVLTELESTILVTGKRKPASRLVVAVDNLDRCSPSKMVDVLESLHNFKGLTKVRFLLVGDEVAFVEGIRSRYPTLSQEGARAYLEKIVSPVIRMPSLKDDPVGLMKILKAMGLEECATEASNSA